MPEGSYVRENQICVSEGSEEENSCEALSTTAEVQQIKGDSARHGHQQRQVRTPAAPGMEVARSPSLGALARTATAIGAPSLGLLVAVLCVYSIARMWILA